MKKSLVLKLLLLVPFILFLGFEMNNHEVTKPLINTQRVFQQKQNTKQSTDKGFGPIKEVKLGPINQKLVDKGNSIFYDKCSLCHDIDDVNLAPPLRGVTKKLSPEFIMNYLMNTAENQKKDPYVKKLIQQWKTVPMMKDQHLKKKDARAVLEFLRSLDK